jgi:hypothetical protein
VTNVSKEPSFLQLNGLGQVLGGVDRRSRHTLGLQLVEKLVFLELPHPGLYSGVYFIGIPVAIRP